VPQRPCGRRAYETPAWSHQLGSFSSGLNADLVIRLKPTDGKMTVPQLPPCVLRYFALLAMQIMSQRKSGGRDRVRSALHVACAIDRPRRREAASSVRSAACCERVRAKSSISDGRSLARSRQSNGLKFWPNQSALFRHQAHQRGQTTNRPVWSSRTFTHSFVSPTSSQIQVNRSGGYFSIAPRPGS
jgi:hypothetical protein